jgi:hypothetical protein
MAQVFRVSLVKMTYAKQPSQSTPSPFLELRAFCFLDKIPAGMYLSALRRSLDSSIQEIIDQILPHIFYGRQGSFRFDEQTPKAQISVRQMTRFYKVEIDGMEVEPIDLDEIFTERLYWDRIPFDHALFKRERIGRVITGKEKLKLITRRIYRYMAFYNEDGSLKQDYDEGDIRDMLQKISVVQQRFRTITQMFAESTSLLERTTDELEKAVSDLERLTRRFKP